MISKIQEDDAEGPIAVAVTAAGATTESLGVLLRSLPPLPGAAVAVVLQGREALDEDALRRAAQEGGREVEELADDRPVEPGRLYVAGPGLIATVEGGRFRTRPAEQIPGSRGVIDSFLVSVAQDVGPRVVVVALAGTDGDGTLGLREVKKAGGLALAEETAESQAGDLAASDSPAALADAVLPVTELAARVATMVQQVAEGPPADPSAGPDAPGEAEALAEIAAVLRARTGHDFHGYKPATFLRRVRRRMQVLQVDGYGQYVDALRTRPMEAQDLFNDLLIGVTEFFRDPREWEILEREVIPKLFEGRTPRETVRLWVVGCSTGEEAYSLAILLAEQRARLEDPPPVQIFASDLDGRALAAARTGRFTGALPEQMSPERLGRWFVKEGDTYHVVKDLREMCIFSQHSIIKDAPFSRLDLVSCRNLLIYLDAELQAQVIPLFHFALKSGGILFLGNSENASRHTSLFAPIEPRSRIFRRLDTTVRTPPAFPLTSVDRRLLGQTGVGAQVMRARMDAGDLAQRAHRIAERHAPAYVIVDESQTVLHFSGNMGRYIAPSGGAASLSLFQLVHSDLRLGLRIALARAAESNQPARVEGVEIGVNGDRRVVELLVEPIREDPRLPTSFVVLFKDGAPPSDDRAHGAGGLEQDEHVHRLDEELRATKDRLQATIEELESTNEELKSSNEEYQSLNEELQSANEELETSKEELQSVNEELTTVNGELAHRVQELGRANSDLKNFLEATQIATLFLDNELRVTNFTPAIVEIFHLVDADLGRPIGHIKPLVTYGEIEEDARRVLRTLASAEREVDDPEASRRYIVRMLPYRSTDNFIAGVVLTFLDVTARRTAEQRLRESEDRYRAIVETARDYAIFTADAEGRIETWPAGAEEVFGWTAAEARGQPMEITYTPEDLADSVPQRERREARERGHATDVRWHLRKDGSRVFIEGTVRPLSGRDGRPAGFVKVGQDITERRATEAALRESELRFRQFGEASSDVLSIQEAETLAFEYVSPAFEAVFGMGRDALLSGNQVRRWLEAIHPKDREAAVDHLRRVREGQGLVTTFRIRRRSDGVIRWLRMTGFPLRDEANGVERVAGIIHDATEEVELSDRFRVLVAELQHRTRNLVGVVRAVVDRTLAGSNSLEEFRDRFGARLQALGRVNGLLSRLEDGQRITFGSLLRTELVAHGAIDSEGRSAQVRLEGADGGRLRSSTVQTLALALHELTTNAVKYGALSRPEGRLEVTWALIPDRDGQQRLRVHWRETCGWALDRVATSSHSGYGRELIERALPYQLGAETSFDLTPEGVRCTITLPLSSTMGEVVPQAGASDA